LNQRLERPAESLKVNYKYGRHDWIRTSDLFRVNLHLTFTFNDLTAHGIPPKHLYLRVSRLNFG
jgi:hypothetical protein